MVAGVKLSTGYNDWFAIPNLLPNAPDGFSWDTGPRGLYESSSSMEAGPLTSALPLEPFPGLSLGGARMTSYFDDFYNRIYVTPTSIDFGAISDTAQVSVRVWNAYFDQSVTLTSIGYDSSLGLSVSGAEVPSLFPPLGYKDYTVTASSDGPPVIDDHISWFFDLPWAFAMPVAGIRSKTWLFAPNWGSKPYQVNYEFKTEIVQSRSGKEQRTALRTSPRKNIIYSTLLTGDTFRRFKDLMWEAQHRSFAMPEMTRFAESALSTTVGEPDMTLTEAPIWIVEGAPVLVGTLGVFELRVVDSVVGDVVTFRAGGAVAWPVGARVYPALAGYVDTEVAVPRDTNAVAQVAMRFNVTPTSEPFITPPAATTTFNGREVFLKKPNWAASVDIAAGHDVDSLDYGRGPVFRYTAIGFGYNTKKATYLNRSRDEAQDIVDFFFRMKGQQGEFYLPTWEYDFLPKVAAPGGSSAIRVTGTDFADAYGDSTVHKAMFVQMNDGSLLFREVLSVTKVTDVDGEDSLITVDASWPTTVSQSTIVMCGWMPAWRLASDILTMEWLTDAVAQTQLTMLTIEDLPVETP